MKKLLVVLLALVMVIAMATSAMAFTDTDDLSTVQQDAIYRLYALGVLNGYPDGSIGADNQITRAEFAKIACIASGMGDVSSIMANTPSSFSDVAIGMWYTGYVNVASSQGFINGYPDGTFKPNQTITMAEVVTILMRIAGYNDNLPGPWPFDYIAEAGKQDVTDDVTFVSNVPATRAQVAVMTNNLLDVILVDYDNDLSKFVEDEDDTTVLEDSFSASVLDDVVFDNDIEDPDQVDGWRYSDFDDNEIDLLTSEGTLAMNENCYISGGMGLTDLGGMAGDIILNDDDEVIYVHVTSYIVYTDDIDGTIHGDTLEIADDSVDVNDDYAEWYSHQEEVPESDPVEYITVIDFDNDGYYYAKVFFNSAMMKFMQYRILKITITINSILNVYD